MCSVENIRHGHLIRKNSNGTWTFRIENTTTFISICCHTVSLPAGMELEDGPLQLLCSVALGPFCFGKYAFINSTLVSPPQPDWNIRSYDLHVAVPPRVGRNPLAETVKKPSSYKYNPQGRIGTPTLSSPKVFKRKYYGS
jgi:hypothetical protein